jgi:glycerol kinase
MRVLAIDQGTTSTRALVFEHDAPPQVVASFRHRQIYPAAGWVEHDPLEILAHVRACIAAAGPIDAIGLANQGESCLAWDAVTGEPLSPLIVWQDNRTAPRIERMRGQGAAAMVRARAGLPLDSYFSGSKLRWILDACPGTRAAAKAGRLCLGTSDAFLLHHLTGRAATDVTTASRTALMNLATCAWDPDLCALFGVPIEALPPIRPTDAGFGDCAGIPLRAAMVDQQAALHGHGACHPGDAKVTFGTGAFALVHAGTARPDPGDGGLIATVAWHAGDQPPVYALEGGVYDAGAALEWAGRIGLIADTAELDRLPDTPAIAGGLVFVPALSGLACPQWRRDATGHWAGMTTATTRTDLQRSLLEGIALQTDSVLAAVDRQVPLGPVIAADGGVAANDTFLAFLADISGRSVRRAGSPEMTAYGCARLAGHRGPPPGAPRLFHPRITPAERQAWRDRYAQVLGGVLA